MNNSDVSLLKLENIPSDIDIHYIDYINHRGLDVKLYPGQQLLIVGFPYGLSSYSLMPIRKSGIVSSEVDFNFKGLNCFLIDAGTRGGMSGSPVFAYFPGGSYELNTGDSIVDSGNYYKFLGIYSARLTIPSDERKKLGKESCEQLDLLGSDIGQVWKENNLDILLSYKNCTKNI